MLNKKEPLEIIKRIYEGNIEFDDKPFVNTECDKIYMEIEEVRKKNISTEVLFQKFDDLINLLEVECFARGARFMYDLLSEVKSVTGE